MKTAKMAFEGVILEIELGPVQSDREPFGSWRNGKVTFDGNGGGTITMGGCWIEDEESANQKNEELGIAGGLRQGVSYRNEVRAGDYTPYRYGEDESGWEDRLMSRIYGDDWRDRENADSLAREVYAAVQKELAKLA